MSPDFCPLDQARGSGVPGTHRLPSLASGPRRSLCSLWESIIIWEGGSTTLRDPPSLMWAALSRGSQSQSMWQGLADRVHVV